MSMPFPKDPLDEPISRFVAAVKDFLVNKAVGVEPPTVVRTQNPLADLVRGWEDLKRQLRRLHEALVGAEPEAKEQLQKIVSLGAEVAALTDDQNIVGPVGDLVRMASEERADMENAITRLGQATSVPTVLGFFADAVGVGSRTAARRNDISIALDALTAYYLLRLPPRNSA